MRLLSQILDRQTARQTFFTLIVAGCALCLISACTMQNGHFPQTAEEMKTFIQQPAPLLGLMLVAALASAFKQMTVARRADATKKISPGVYFIDNWPETLISLGATIGLWLTLLMTDSLNWAAIAFGYVANDAADAFTEKGRSSALGSNPPTKNPPTNPT